MSDKSKGIFDLCAFCPSLCMDRCPVVAATGRNTWTPQSRMMVGWLVSRSFLEMNPESLNTIYQCTGCMSCHEPCLHEIDVETALFGLRASFVESGVTVSTADHYVDAGTDLERIYLDVVPADYVVPDAGAAVFPGAAVLRSNPAVITDLFKCFTVLGVDTVAAVPSAAIDSGYDLYAAGFIKEFKVHAGKVAKVLRRYKKIVVVSPKDYFTLTSLYTLHDVMMSAEIVLAVDLLAPLILARKPRKASADHVGYHDSCISGRHLEHYELPRRIIAHITGRPAIELRRNHKDSMCCGAAGAWNISNPVGSSEAGRNIAKMAVEAGVNVLVTSGCECAVNMNGKVDKLGVKDLISFVAGSL